MQKKLPLRKFEYFLLIIGSLFIGFSGVGSFILLFKGAVIEDFIKMGFVFFVGACIVLYLILTLVIQLYDEE
jgi:hypothetical protein